MDVNNKMANFQDGGQQNNNGHTNMNSIDMPPDSHQLSSQSYGSDTYNKQNDNMSIPHYNNRNIMNDRHTGQDFTQRNNQYGMLHTRGHFPQSGGPYNHHRMSIMSEHPMQQNGPTPTLNQLLTNANAGQQYSSNTYGQNDYSKSNNEVNNSTSYNQMWAGQQRPMGSYNSTGQYANQVIFI